MIFIENKKVFGIGRVTERGVVFKELYYSCDMAIKNRWFERARVSGPWIVFIILDQDTPDKLLLIEPVGFELITCYLIKHNTESGRKLDRYFQSIQQLNVARGHRRRSPITRKQRKKKEWGGSSWTN